MTLPLWLALVMCFVSLVFGWLTGALNMGTFLYGKIRRRVGKAHADRLLAPEEQP